MTRDNFTDLTCGVWNREGTLCSQCAFQGIPYDLVCQISKQFSNQRGVQVSSRVTNTANSFVHRGCCLPPQCAPSSMECFCVGNTSTVNTNNYCKYNTDKWYKRDISRKLGRLGTILHVYGISISLCISHHFCHTVKHWPVAILPSKTDGIQAYPVPSPESSA